MCVCVCVYVCVCAGVLGMHILLPPLSTEVAATAADAAESNHNDETGKHNQNDDH